MKDIFIILYTYAVIFGLWLVGLVPGYKEKANNWSDRFLFPDGGPY